MFDKPEWIPNAESECIRNWAQTLKGKVFNLL